MSTARRAYDIMRSYVGQGLEALRDPTESDAERELREAIEQPLPTSTAPVQVTTPPAPPMSVETARRLLNVDASASSKTIQKAYDDLRAAVDPARFAADPEAQSRARDLQARLRMALSVLQNNVDPTVRRFEGLEID